LLVEELVDLLPRHHPTPPVNDEIGEPLAQLLHISLYDVELGGCLLLLLVDELADLAHLVLQLAHVQRLLLGLAGVMA